MTIGDDRSPHQTFGRSSWEPDPGDDDLRVKSTVLAPAYRDEVAGRPIVVPEDVLRAPDVARYPWVRSPGQEWTTAALRALVVAWLRAFFAARRDQRLIGWQVIEYGAVRGRVSVDRQALRFIITKRRRCGTPAAVEVAASFLEAARDEASVAALLERVAVSLDTELSTIV